MDGSIEFVVDGKVQVIEGGNIVIVPANTWHEFKNRSSKQSLMINIHPASEMIQEWG